MSKGCKVDTAVNGLEGLGKLKKKKFDMIIADTEILNDQADKFFNKFRNLNPQTSIVSIAGDRIGDLSGPEDKTGVDLRLIKPIEVDRVVKNVIELIMAGDEGKA